MAEPWLMRVEGGLSAHFKVPDGPSRPGVHWAIGLKQGEKTCKVLVKALFADDATPETRANQEYQGQVAMQYLNDCLKKGWHPDQQMEHTVYISNPISDSARAVKKPWWQIW
jgi:hypothetical protein